MKRTKPQHHPVAAITWEKPSRLRSNHYNPNTVFPPELALLRVSLLEDGWTMPVYANRGGYIVDGFHRWTLASTDAEVAAMTGGLLPVAWCKGKTEADAMCSTIRANRARGQHGIVAMGKIVRALLDGGKTVEELERDLGMEEEEIDRLADFTPSPDKAGSESFGRGWVPVAGR